MTLVYSVWNFKCRCSYVTDAAIEVHRVFCLIEIVDYYNLSIWKKSTSGITQIWASSIVT
ncbi:TPA: hypothetical protein EYP75_03030 [Candidatus Bathyarchaeota archaeon]|nr:hypothetical protein [Candidatus Bathyarchaeota archaeon]